jgi:Ca-activated chloride channel family protein
VPRAGLTIVWILVAIAAGATSRRVQDARFRSAADLVTVYATVTGEQGEYIRGLTASDFRILDDGIPRNITTFSNDLQPITVALVVDESGSMLPRLGAVAAAADAFVDALGAADRAAFSTLTHEALPLTADHAALRAAVHGALAWPWWDAGSPLWGALDRSMTALASEGGRRVVVVITDGEDTPSVYKSRPSLDHVARPAVFPNATAAEVASRASAEGFMVYALGFEGAPFEPALRALARQTGGGFRQIGAHDDLPSIFTDIVNDLHRQYLLGFVPAAADGRAHAISVRALVAGAVVRARERYDAN